MSYIERMTVELIELNEKLQKLGVFTDGEYFSLLSEEDQRLLTEQEAYMDAYSDVLGRRLEKAVTGN